MKPRFNFTKMRQQFYAWHGGQDSPLYAAASSGLVADTLALQNELRACAESMWSDPANFTGCRSQRVMKARPYGEWKYLRAVADALPDMLSAPGVASDGRVYRCLPWAKKDGKFPLDFMRPDTGRAA